MDKYEELVDTIRALDNISKNIQLSAEGEGKLVNSGSLNVLKILLNEIDKLEKRK